MINNLNYVKKRLNWLLDRAFIYLGGASFAGDGLISFGKSVSFRSNKKFLSAFEHYCENSEDNSRLWRLHTLCWAAHHALSFQGDFVECGVYRGFFSSVVTQYINFKNESRTFWLYDTFKGFSTKYSKPSDFKHGKLFMKIAKYEYGKADHLKFVKARFSRYQNVKVIQGVLPDVLKKQCPKKIAYLHIDLNSPQAEYLTLERLYPLVVDGGVIVFDDYGWKNFKKQQDAIHKFFTQTGEMILELPTGQGLVIKKQ